MKNYIAPDMEVIAFRAEDIITTSGEIIPAGINVSNGPATYTNALERFNG